MNQGNYLPAQYFAIYGSDVFLANDAVATDDEGLRYARHGKFKLCPVDSSRNP